MGSRISRLLLVLGLLIISGFASAQDHSQAAAQKNEPLQTSDPVPRSDSDQPSEAPPLTEKESSSKQTQIDISPTKNDAAKPPESDLSDVTEMHPYNPH